MEDLIIESKQSTIGLIIKIVVFSFLINWVFNRVERRIGEMETINWILIIGTIAYFVYGYFTDKTLLTIKDNKVLTESRIGFPKKHIIKEFDLTNAAKIRLVQSQDFVYGRKTMEVINHNGKKEMVELKLRYYQLVKLEEYLRGELKIATTLVG